MMDKTTMPNPVRHPAWRIWSNPIFCRYARSRLRLPATCLALLVTLVLAGFIHALSHQAALRSGMNAEDAARATL
ncbi:MAG: hypothetical protein ACO3RV_08630, partial [Luteolibacter sp.]